MDIEKDQLTTIKIMTIDTIYYLKQFSDNIVQLKIHYQNNQYQSSQIKLNQINTKTILSAINNSNSQIKLCNSVKDNKQFVLTIKVDSFLFKSFQQTISCQFVKELKQQEIQRQKLKQLKEQLQKLKYKYENLKENKNRIFVAQNQQADYQDYKTRIASITLLKGKYVITISFLLKVPTSNAQLWVYALIQNMTKGDELNIPFGLQQGFYIHDHQVWVPIFVQCEYTIQNQKQQLFFAFCYNYSGYEWKLNNFIMTAQKIGES